MKIIYLNKEKKEKKDFWNNELLFIKKKRERRKEMSDETVRMKALCIQISSEVKTLVKALRNLTLDNRELKEVTMERLKSDLFHLRVRTEEIEELLKDMKKTTTSLKKVER